MSNPFFSPKGVAIVGASQDSHKLGYGVIRNLIEYRYKGGIYPVNPKAYEILGKQCYESVDMVPNPVDLAVIIVPAKAVQSVLKECGERGIKHAIIVTGGFSETGEEGKLLEQRLLKVAEEYEMSIIGPNCIGTIDTHTPVNTTFVVGMPEPGEIGFISHSGAMVAAIIDWASGSGIGFSRIASLGNQIDVNETQMIEDVAEDDQTKVITAYLEGVANGSEFMKAARKAAQKKPFLVLKGGHGESGAKAVASHTGALAGSSEAYEAAFRYCGIQEAETIEEMFEWARAMAWQPLPKGNRVAVLTNAGGPAILAVDALEREGLKMAEISPKTKEYLSSRLPKAASVNNPVDVLAGSGPATYTLALEALLTDEQVDAVLVIQAPQDWFLPVSLAEVVGEVASAHNKTVVTSIMGKASVEEALKILQKRRIPNVAFPERSASLIAAMRSRFEWLNSENDTKVTEISVDKDAAAIAVKNEDWKSLLREYGILFPRQKVVSTVEEAIEFSNSLSHKIAMKLQSEAISHKSDVGGVILNLKNEQEIHHSWEKLEEISTQNNASFEGVLVQEMVEDSQEVIIGINRDQQFGPMILFGTGGTDVELYKDVQTSIAPLNLNRAQMLVDQTKAGRKLKGWRNMSPRDEQNVLHSLMALSQISQDFPEIEELEVNPLCVLPAGDGAVAIDVRGKLKD